MPHIDLEQVPGMYEEEGQYQRSVVLYCKVMLCNALDLGLVMPIGGFGVLLFTLVLLLHFMCGWSEKSLFPCLG